MAKGHRKYFLAIVIPEPYQAQIERVKEELRASHNLKGALRSPAHITLHRPFEWKEEKECALISALKEFNYEADFEIELSGYGFFAPRVIFVDVKNNHLLLDLHLKLARFAQNKLRLINEINDERGFHPHVTIAFRDLKRPVFAELRPRFEQRDFNAVFRFSGFALLKLEDRWEVLHEFWNRP